MVDKNKKIILALLDNRLTQRELSKRARVHETRVSLIVNGRLIPSESEADRIAKTLNCNRSEIFDKVA